jgi:hypothetical protein
VGPYEPGEGRHVDLVKHFNPSLNFGQVRQELRHVVGIAPSFRTASRDRKGRGNDRPVRERWAARPRLRPGSPAWCYLADERCIPPEIPDAAARLDAVREGHHGSACLRIGGGVRSATSKRDVADGRHRGADRRAHPSAYASS